MHSSILSSDENSVSTRFHNDSLLLYNHDYSISIFSEQQVLNYQIHDMYQTISKGIIGGKDYIGMTSNSGVSYDIGNLKSGESKIFTLFILMNENRKLESQEIIENKIDKIKKIDVNKKLQEISKYWKKYLQDHIKHDTDNMGDKIRTIYKRSILLFPLLTNKKTGAIIAAPEIDEGKKYSGGYSYCWPRDAVFIAKALDLIGMEQDATNFYLNFCKSTQSKNGMWEQRFYTNGNLAPCWGYQIDETASVVYGIYEHYRVIKDIEFLKHTVKMCEMATKFLCRYIENVLQIEEKDIVKKEIQEKYSGKEKIEKHLSYDLWEMNEGIHLYSLSSIYAAFNALINIEEELQKNDNANNRIKQEITLNMKIKLESYKDKIKNYIIKNFYDEKQKIFYRNLNDKKMDISILGSTVPFNVFLPNEKTITNTAQKIGMTLRTYTGGYLRFEDDHYRGGNCPWVISTLWMALYYIEIGNIKEASECLNFVINSASSNGLLSEQVDNSLMQPSWVLGLGWSHAMFIIVLNALIDKEM